MAVTSTPPARPLKLWIHAPLSALFLCWRLFLAVILSPSPHVVLNNRLLLKATSSFRYNFPAKQLSVDLSSSTFSFDASFIDGDYLWLCLELLGPSIIDDQWPYLTLTIDDHNPVDMSWANLAWLAQFVSSICFNVPFLLMQYVNFVRINSQGVTKYSFIRLFYTHNICYQC